MDSKDFIELQDSYKLIYSESKKDESPEKEEEDRKKDDDLFGSPNKNGNGKNGNGKNGDDDKNGKNGKKKAKRWWDDDGDGKGYEKGEVKEAVYGQSAEKVEAKRRKDDDLFGSPKKKMVVTNADKKANTPAYQKYKAGDKRYAAADHLKNEEVALQEKKDKDTPDQVKAVIAYDKARKGTDDATYDSEHGDKKQAKKERDYAKWQRDQGAEFAQKSGHPWEHAKGSTREKEGKKSVKHAHVKDSYDPQREYQLWDEVAEKLTELHEINGVKFKVVPFDLEEDSKWIQKAVKRPGAFTKKAKAAGMSVQQFAKHVDDNKSKYSTRTERQANLAQTFASMKKEGADFDALSEFLINEGADEQAVQHIMANWVLEGYQRNPEEGERKERADAKKREAIPGQASRGMPPRGDKKREEFERWYAANVR